MNVDGTGFTTLKHFTGPDGAGPYAGLVLSGGTLFGVTVRGGAFSSQAGTVFKLNTDGSGFAVLKSFNASAFPPQGIGPMGRLLLAGNGLYGTGASVLNFTPGVSTVFRLNTDGTDFATVMVGAGGPGAGFFSQAGLVLSGSTLYGTMNGPTLSSGLGSALDQVFSVNTNGTGRTMLKRFDNSSGDEASLPGPLVLAVGTLYGASAFGGTSNRGTVFQLDTNGGGYTVLKHFNPSTDGSGPRARLAFSGQTLYGVAGDGGPNNWGTLFKLDANGGNFGLVKSFDGVVVGTPAGLTLSSDTLFGTAAGGGSNASGSVHKVNTNGSGFTVLKDFNDGPGYGPLDEPLVAGNTLYGNTQDGVIFKMNTDGTGFTVLCSIATNAPLIYHLNRLALAGNTLYGMAYAGTNYPAGAIYKVNTDGTGLGVVAYLTDARLGFYTSSRGGLLISGWTIYGATRSAIFKSAPTAPALRSSKPSARRPTAISPMAISSSAARRFMAARQPAAKPAKAQSSDSTCVRDWPLHIPRRT